MITLIFLLNFSKKLETERKRQMLDINIQIQNFNIF